MPVYLAYQGDGAAAKKPHLTAILYWVERRDDRNPDRVLCKTKEGDEFFRMPPLLMVARYLLTAWAPPPDDQELLAAAIRVLYDAVELKPESDEPDRDKNEDAVHWEDHPTLDLVQRFSLDEARITCEALGIPLRPSVRYDVNFRLDSERKTVVKRVKERIVDYKKLDA